MDRLALLGARPEGDRAVRGAGLDVTSTAVEGRLDSPLRLLEVGDFDVAQPLVDTTVGRVETQMSVHRRRHLHEDVAVFRFCLEGGTVG